VSGFARPLVRLSVEQHRRIVAHCWYGLPDEACGLLIGTLVDPSDDESEPTGHIVDAYPTRNEDASARTYTVHGQDYGAARKSARAQNAAIVGCWHSHTHTDAYPSPTDVNQAKWYPSWIYVIVSLKYGEPVLRAYRIRDERIEECQVVLENR
jgi:proteasome lid subunit RPN8/RPN11